MTATLFKKSIHNCF